MDPAQRLICRYDGSKHGPLFICLGGIHGNEPAGIQAISIVSTLLSIEPSVNPDFVFHGRFLGLIGNTQAVSQHQRFLQMDLNRALTSENIRRVMNADPGALRNEDREVYELLTTIHDEVKEYQPERIVVLDIHSTSAAGGIFVIASEDPRSVHIGTELHAPVILDFAQEVNGTTLGYFNRDNFAQDIVSVVFECGQHNEPLSVNRAIAAIINCMRTIGCVSEDAVENKHDLLLQEYSKGLPKVSRLIERYGIPNGHPFNMARAFQNFEQVSANEIIAFEGETPIRAHHDGLILLPRLQEQGDDGFFIVSPVSQSFSEELVTT